MYPISSSSPSLLAERYSTKDWLHNLATIPSSRLLKRINGVIFFNFLWSTVVYVLHNILKFESPGSRCHSLLGGALGLLLVFRTNTAYNRFWEGRKIWERLLSSLRDMGRMTVVYGDVIGNAAVSRMLLLLCVFPMILQEHVQGFRHSDKELSEFLSQQELREIERVTNRPYFLINKIHKEVGWLDDLTMMISPHTPHHLPSTFSQFTFATLPHKPLSHAPPHPSSHPTLSPSQSALTPRFVRSPRPTFSPSQPPSHPHPPSHPPSHVGS